MKDQARELFDSWSGRVELRGAWEESEAPAGYKVITSTPVLDDPQIQFFSVYVVDKEGMSQCIADFQTEEEAEFLTDFLSEAGTWMNALGAAVGGCK